MISNPKFKVLILAAGSLLISLILFYCSILSPPENRESTRTILIKKGSSLKKISELLERERIIKNKQFFILMTTLVGKKGMIKAGEYEIPTNLYPWQVLSILLDGQVKSQLITIPEGYTVNQIAQLLWDLNIVDKDEFLKKVYSQDLISSLGLSNLASQSLEGLLFPETYHLMKEMDPEEVIRIMVNQFKKVFYEELNVARNNLKISEREIIIMASIIEKETSLSEEKPLISAVFYNRLNKNMPLQSDPTVIYGLKDFDGNLKKEHLTKQTVYNTYIKSGLPPTPICNPGRESIRAAIFPAQVPYLYFVSKNDGSHFFSSSLEEHNRAVLKYQKSFKNGLKTMIKDQREGLK